MEIKILNSQTIKLTLSIKDMKKYNITHEILKTNEKITKNLVVKLLGNIKDQITIDTEKNKLFLESFKTKEKGCVLYLSIPNTSSKKIDQKEKQTATFKIPIISIFKTQNNLKNFCKTLKNLSLSKNIKSELYEFNNKSILTIFVPQKEKDKFLALTKEFGKIYGEGLIKMAIVREHCKTVFDSNAIEKILKQ